MFAQPRVADGPATEGAFDGGRRRRRVGEEVVEGGDGGGAVAVGEEFGAGDLEGAAGRLAGEAVVVEGDQGFLAAAEGNEGLDPQQLGVGGERARGEATAVLGDGGEGRGGAAVGAE